MEEDKNKLEVTVNGTPAPWYGRENLANGAIRNSMPEEVKGIFDGLVANATSVNIKIITAPTYNHPRLAYYAYD